MLKKRIYMEQAPLPSSGVSQDSITGQLLLLLANIIQKHIISLEAITLVSPLFNCYLLNLTELMPPHPIIWV